jgi:CHAT domain-containing protein/tetratricopeptide (TPR) repeat protein
MKSNFLILVLVAGLSAGTQGEQTSAIGDVRILLPGTSVESEIRGRDLQTYQMRIVAGQYVRVAIDHTDAILSVKLMAPDGEKLLEVLTPYSAQDPARLSLIARISGPYLIQLTAVKNDSAAKKYTIKIEELREATWSDQSRTTAERLFAEAETLRVNGDANDLRASIERYRSALDLWRTLGLRRDEAYTLLLLGSVSHNLSQPKDALGYYDEALTLWRSLGNRSKEAQTLSGMGWTYYSIGDLQKALDCYNQALPIRGELNDLRGQAQTLTTIGQIYKSLGEPQRASEHYNQSLPLAREVGDKVQEAFAINNFALLYIDVAEYQRALSYVDQALPLWRETGNRYGEADALNSAGIVYEELGDFDKALEYFDRALKAWRHLGNQLGEADELNNLGILYTSMGQLQDSPALLQKALEVLTKALAIRRTSGQLLGETDTLVNLGLAYEYLGKGDMALDYFKQVLRIDPKSPTALHNIGLNLYSHLEYRAALEYFRRALEIFRERGNRTGEAETLRMIAAAQANLGNISEALSNSRAALDIIDTLWAKITDSDVRISYRAVTRDYYVQLIDLLFRQHELNPAAGTDVVALEINERARARGLLDLLLEPRVEIRSDLAPGLLEREHTLQRQLSAKEQYRLRLLNDKSAEAERLAVEDDIRSLSNEYQETRASIRTNDPRYAALAQPASLSLQEIQQTVLDGDTILLEYCLGESRSFLWAVTKTSISSYLLPSRREIEMGTRRVYDLLTQRNNHPGSETPEQRVTRVGRADTEFNQASSALSQMLLGPLVTQLRRKRLVFVTDGILQYVPFSALPEPRAINGPASRPDETRPQPLIVEHEIVNLASASVLAVLRNESKSRKSAPGSVAVIADPVFSQEDPRLEARMRENVSQLQQVSSAVDNVSRTQFSDGESKSSTFARLRFSGEEAKQIIAFAPPATSLKLSDFDANRDTVMTANLDQYHILHFATHGLLNGQRPELSGLVLSLVDVKGQRRDGFLGLHEIYNLRLNADLVVLSGCQTALGKDVRGEGLIGLTRGFMYAGASRVIASLWGVDDRATAELMKRFYRGMLSQRMRPAAALKAAQTELRAERGWQAPYYWAAFTLEGDWR